ncbi:cupredoxin domain-containing protein [Methylobacterium isbiliense]|jgi:plastocyanin|uniref:EfeO-type cupredoxin-like domain-containing protein n=1 Tax=Methylobacterium isbiliense TaxID=315478 RepID=A0ABQ4SCC5_9HYPH|nr:cupredoxin domain-containing protein [Methylobacterium isbiliense]MDN3622037.1 cupredoxin domain-containing protein [Methylobacterium isbiliense]GJD99449.1 hypothetical protein GMJLKIPL_1366 [Methylobacterium isbiliense]
MSASSALCRSLAAALALTSTAALAAQQPAPPRATDASPPVEVTISQDGGTTRCEPATLRLPAETDVTLSLVNQSGLPATVTAPKMFENRQILHHDGGLAHIANESGFTVRPSTRGEVKLRTLAPGEYDFSCATTRNQGTPSRGKLVLVAPNQ